MFLLQAMFLHLNKFTHSQHKYRGQLMTKNAHLSGLNQEQEIVWMKVGEKEKEHALSKQSDGCSQHVSLLQLSLSLLSSGDPLCVVSTAIKPSGLFLAHMWSQGEVLMKYRGLFLAELQRGMCFSSCISVELLTLTPWIPAVTRFPLRSHHLLTHRLTSLTLQPEGVAASMKRWLGGNHSASLSLSLPLCVWERDPYPKLNKSVWVYLRLQLQSPQLTLHCVYGSESGSSIWD